MCPAIIRADRDDTAVGGKRAVPHTKSQEDRKNNEGHRGEGLFQRGAASSGRRLYHPYRKRNAPDKVMLWAQPAKSISFCGYVLQH